MEEAPLPLIGPTCSPLLLAAPGQFNEARWNAVMLGQVLHHLLEHIPLDQNFLRSVGFVLARILLIRRAAGAERN